jgi:hypothetical protein
VITELKNKLRLVGPTFSKVLQKTLIHGVKVYQKSISPFFAPSCRFHPTCSSYMIQALNLHGAVKGLWLGVRRIGRCHPFNEGGIDNVPETEKSK